MKSLLVLLILASSATAQSTITIDTTISYQTIEGWGHGGDLFSNLAYALPALGINPALQDSLNLQCLGILVKDLGLTGSRMWEVGPRTDGTGMDNGDCDSLDWSRFMATSRDTAIAQYVQYFQRLVQAQGFRTSFYSSPTYPTFATAFKPWVLNHPGERAQQIWATALWWKEWGIDIDYAVIQNEPGGAWSPQTIADDIAALGPRLEARGLRTKAQFAEGVDPRTSWSYDTSVHRGTDWWNYVGRLSYHRYGGDDPYRSYLVDSAKTHGITVAQTEMSNPSIASLISDLTIGNVSYWEVGFAGSNILQPSYGNSNWTPSQSYFRLRQLLHYVRPGALRIEAASTDSLLTPVAFRQNGRIVTVIYNKSTARSITLHGLPPGSYGVSQADAGTLEFQESGIQNVGIDGTLALQIGGGAALTVYPYGGANQAPTIESCSANPGYLLFPVSSLTLTSRANDVELDPLGYHWSVASAPGGATVSFATPDVATTSVSGMSVAGTYVFAIDVTDGTHHSTRKVYVQAYSVAPSPALGQSGFRFAQPYGLVFAPFGTETHANVELPTSSATLQVGVGDLANSDFTGRGKWTLVSQPPTANVKLDSTIYIFVSVRAQVSNMTVPGDYVFQCNITNPGHPDLLTRATCTVHPPSAAPIIQKIDANPPTLTLPASVTELSVTTGDTSGQLLRHWWALKSAPTGALVAFEHQGRATTAVRGLTQPGTYIFTLRAFDDIHMSTKDIACTVLESAKVPSGKTKESIKLSIVSNPIINEIRVRYTCSDASHTVLDLYDEQGALALHSNLGSLPSGNGLTTLDVRALSSGAYHLVVRDATGVSAIPVIIER
jgi:hypothetical protein